MFNNNYTFEISKDYIDKLRDMVEDLDAVNRPIDIMVEIDKLDLYTLESVNDTMSTLWRLLTKQLNDKKSIL